MQIQASLQNHPSVGLHTTARKRRNGPPLTLSPEPTKWEVVVDDAVVDTLIATLPADPAVAQQVEQDLKTDAEFFWGAQLRLVQP